MLRLFYFGFLFWVSIPNKANNDKEKRDYYRHILQKKTQRKYANITENIKKQEESKQIYKENITKILDNIIKIRKEEMQTQSIYILVKGIEGIKYNELQKMLENYKIIYIVAKNLKNFEELEKKAEENLDMLAIVNNKRKSLARC